MSGDDLLLPLEICYQILTKLPVKSILRCRCVCKTWYSLVSSPNFISDHSAQTLNQSTSNRVLVHRTELATGLCKLSSHDESFVVSHEHDDLPEPLRSPGVEIVGHCNGLICFRRKPDIAQSFLIWNPSIRKSIDLPMPSSSNESYLLGFGFDYQSSDYKVLRTVLSKCNSAGELVLVESQIFCLGKGVWRSLSLTMRPGLYYVPHSCTHLNGILHWIREDISDCTLLFFNLSSEVFQEMGMPFRLEFHDYEFQHYDTKLFPVNGLLSVALLRRHVQGDDHQDWCSVWSMKEYGSIESWTKLFHIKLPCNLTWWLTRLVRCWENCEVLIRDQDRRKNNKVLVLYNLESRESKVLLSTSAIILDVCYYTESLVLL